MGGVSTRRGKGIVTRAVAIGKGNVKEGVQALRRGLHAKTATHQLQTPYREGRAIRQEHVTCGETVCHKGDARLVLGVALVVGPSLGGHARKRVRVDLGGTCRHMGDTTAGEARGNSPREGGEICQGEKSTVALAQRHPLATAKLRKPQVLEIPDD